MAYVTADDAILAEVTDPSVGVRASDNRESFPWQNVPEVVPKLPAERTPLVVVMIGRPDVDPIAPAFVICPC